VERAAANDFFDSTLRTRLSDQTTGAFVIIMQRLADDDLTGHVTQKWAAEGWTHIILRMEAEEDEEWRFPISGRVVERKQGELLWEARFPHDVCESLKTDKMVWAGQYQQRPAPLSGIIFNPEGWMEWDALPQFDEVIVSVDCAFKALEDSDFVSVQAWGFIGPRSYLLARKTERMGYTATKMAIRSMLADLNIRKLRPSAVIIEDKANGSAVIEELSRETLGCSVLAIEPEGGKIARAWACSADVEAHNVFLPKDVNVLGTFVDVCTKFPKVAHDDDVDAFTQALNWRRSRIHSLAYVEYLKKKMDEQKEALAKPAHSAATPTCPKCGSLAVTMIQGRVHCNNCQYQEKPEKGKIVGGRMEMRK
jgi:predicted phage terminase large subunit-like protein